MMFQTNPQLPPRFHLTASRAVQSIRIATAHDHKQRPFEIWIVNTRDGRSNEIDPGDLWIRNRDDIIDRLRKLGVEIGK